MINRLLYMDDLMVYGKDEAQIDSLVKTVHMVSKDIGMEFGIKKCGEKNYKKGKVSEYHGIVLPNGEVMKGIEQN